MNSKTLLEKTAVIGIDLEDWYHLDYISTKKSNISMLDGFYRIIDILNKKKILASIFVVGDLINSLRSELKLLSKNNFEIGSHGYSHQRPLTLSKKDFINEIQLTKKTLEDLINKRVIGFRAPCFSLNRELLDTLFNNGYLYDSSKINFNDHELYGNIDLNDFKQVNQYVYLKYNNKKKNVEFEIPTHVTFIKKIPFSGGGYLRVLPQILIKKIIKAKENQKVPIFFYIHPFEFSDKVISRSNIGTKNFVRMNIGRKKMHEKFVDILDFMIQRKWQFTTFKNLYDKL